MPRQSDDTWGPASGVGVTATACAAGRALAARRYPELMEDPYAADLVDAVGIEAYARMARDEGGSEMVGSAAESAIPYTVARTKFFDDFLIDATFGHGIKQVVILASGLDTRSYRLSWPPATVVFEVDQPEITSFKTQTLQRVGAVPTATRNDVGIDLRHDWPAVLQQAGFSIATPTAWIAEGLFGYLPPDAHHRLLDQVTAQSAAGSRIAIEYVDAPDLLQTIAGDPTSMGLNDAGDAPVTCADLIYGGQRHDTDAYLSTHGWVTTRVGIQELRLAYGLPSSGDPNLLTNRFAYVSASMPSQPTS